MILVGGTQIETTAFTAIVEVDCEPNLVLPTLAAPYLEVHALSATVLG